MDKKDISSTLKNKDSINFFNAIHEKEYDAITELASIVCQTPYASISLIKVSQQFYKSCFGFNTIPKSINQSFSGYTVKQSNPICIIENAALDNRFTNKSCHINDSKIVFYAGIQLINPSNEIIGVLSVYDHKPNTLTDLQTNALKLLANQVIQLIELHTSKIELKHSESKYKSMIDNSIIPILFSNPSTERVIDANKAACDLFGYSVEEFKTLPREVFIVHDTHSQEILQKRKESGLLGVELQGIKKNGDRFLFEGSSTIFKNNNGDLRSISFINDISERRKIEIENSKLMNNSEVLFVMTDCNFKIISFNKQFQKLYQYYFGVEIVIGGSFIDYAHPLDRDKEIEICHRVINGASEENEFTVVKDYTKTSFLLKYHPTRDENNKINGMFVSAFDITKRKNAERELVKRERELSLIYNNVNDSIFLVENEGNDMFKIASMNQSYFKITGFKEEEVIGRYLNDFVPETVLINIIKNLHIAISTKNKVTWEDERKYATGLKTIITTMTPIFNAKGVCTQLIGTIHDVTEERIALKEREKISSQLAKIMQSSLDVICTIDESGNFVTVSSASEKIWGYLPEEIIGKPFINLVSEADRADTHLTINEIRNGAEFTDFENSFIKKDRSIVPILWSIKWDEKDSIIYCTAKDASEKQKHEQELKLSEKKYKYLFQRNPAPLFIWDYETSMIVDCNNEMLSQYGYSREEMLQLNIMQIRPAEEMIAFDELRKKESEFEKIIQFTTKHQKKNGDIMNVKIHAHLMEYNGRKSSLVLVNDITEKLKVKAEIAASEKRYKYLFDNNPAPMYLFDFETLNIIDCNDEILLKYGYTREEFLKLNMIQIRPADKIAEIKKIFENADKNGDDIIKFTTVHQKKNGDQIDVNINAHVMDYNGRKSTLVLIDDITENVKHLKSIEEQNKTLKEIAWMQSHVVRAPLARIMGIIHLINDSSVIEEKGELLKYILDSAIELDAIIKEIVNKSTTIYK